MKDVYKHEIAVGLHRVDVDVGHWTVVIGCPRLAADHANDGNDENDKNWCGKGNVNHFGSRKESVTVVW